MQKQLILVQLVTQQFARCSVDTPRCILHALQAPTTGPPGTSSARGSLDRGSPGQPSHYCSAGATAASDEAATGDTDPFTTVLLIDQPHLGDDECVTTISWGGGPLCTLSAATKHSVSLISLAPFFEERLRTPQQAACADGRTQQEKQQQHPMRNRQQQHPSPQHLRMPQAPDTSRAGSGGAAPDVRMPSGLHRKLDVFRAKAPILSHQWTHDGLGLLVSDSKGGIVMLQVKSSGVSSPAAPRGAIAGSGGGSDDAAADGSGLDSEQAGGSGGAARSAVRELWLARAEAPQDMIAAGASAVGPCASVARDAPQRVVVWWPSRGGAGEFVVGAEVIRHPVRAVHLEWSPALGREGGAAAGGDYGRGQQQAREAGPVAAGEQQADEPPSARHPALMTVGADGVIRVWVEVVMADMDDDVLPPHASPGAGASPAKQAAQQGSSSPPKRTLAAPGSPAVTSPASPAGAKLASRVMSQFCLTLVVEPPAGHGIVPGVLPGMTATWVRQLRDVPLLGNGTAGSTAAAAAAASASATEPNQGAPRVLWLLASYCGPQHAQHSAAAAPPPLHALATSPTKGGPGLAHFAPQQQRQPGWVDAVFLWAIDGLSGVVLRGIAQNAITASKLSAPRAFLWGRDAAAPGWARPGMLAQAGARQTLAAWLKVGPNGAPLLHCSQQFVHGASG